MSNLVEFLKARLNEDEQTARKAAENLGDAYRWSVRGTEMIVPLQAVPDPSDPGVFTVVRAGYDDGQPVVAHIARHDPVRVLTEVEAKRQIIETFRWWWDRPAETDDELHACGAHPDYEYETTEGPRKQWDDASRPPDDDPTWERNIDMGRVGTRDAGWDRLDYTEESYWRRRLPDEQVAERRRQAEKPPTVLALLALPHADHPDYREEWKP